MTAALMHAQTFKKRSLNSTVLVAMASRATTPRSVRRPGIQSATTSISRVVTDITTKPVISWSQRISCLKFGRFSGGPMESLRSLCEHGDNVSCSFGKAAFLDRTLLVGSGLPACYLSKFSLTWLSEQVKRDL